MYKMVFCHLNLFKKNVIIFMIVALVFITIIDDVLLFFFTFHVYVLLAFFFLFFLSKTNCLNSIFFYHIFLCSSIETPPGPSDTIISNPPTTDKVC